MSQEIKGILFDKDGTILKLEDTWKNATIYMFEEEYFYWMRPEYQNQESLKEVEHKVGFVNHEVMPNSIMASGTLKGSAEAMAPYTDLSVEEVYRRMKKVFLKYMGENSQDIKLVEGMDKIIERLHNEGYKLGIVTSDESEMATLMLESVGVMKYFDFLGSADRYNPKPDREMLDVFCEKFDLKPREVMYVGDSQIDYEFSQLMGHFVGVGDDFDEPVDDISDIFSILETYKK